MVSGDAMKPGSSIALVLLSLVFAGHLARLVFKIELVIGATVMPMGLSVVAVVFSGVAISLMWREIRSGKSP